MLKAMEPIYKNSDLDQEATAREGGIRRTEMLKKPSKAVREEADSGFQWSYRLNRVLTIFSVFLSL